MKQKNDDSQTSDFFQSALFTSTILISAFLLFWEQPLFAKMILPILGGSSAVWTTSMLFFQITLLAGYVYAHFSGKYLKITTQVWLHCSLLTIAATSLPFYIDYAQSDVPDGSPAFWVLSLALLTIGPSFFMISSTAPMLQRWFSRTRHRYRENPYFLFAASNLGSMLALLGFPTIIEPALGAQLQTDGWQTGYYLLLALFLATGLLTLRRLPAGQDLLSRSQELPRALTDDRKISAMRRLSWIFLAFIPSSMMLGMTCHVTTDISPVAMFWVVPLALYLLSFVIVFSRWQHLISPRWLAAMIIISGSLLIFMRIAGYDKTISTVLVIVTLNLTLFFLSAWLFHGYLSSSKPATADLTEFYLWMSIGGMLGGFFNALVAPLIFNQVYEYHVIVVTVLSISFSVLLTKPARREDLNIPGIQAMICSFAILLLIFLLVDQIMSRPITTQVQLIFMSSSLGIMLMAGISAYYKPAIMPRRMAIIVVVLGVLGNILVLTQTHANILLTRSFYGALKVKLKLDINDTPYHLFIHGSTRHNLQKFGPDLVENQKPLMYFHRQANIGHAVTAMQVHLDRPMHLGFVGLGAGAMSAYAEVGDTVSYYEIDPEVVAMAQNRDYFTYLSETKGNVEILVGDARLQLKKARDSSFDILLIDAFSSDAIPVHLLTAEAVTLYLRKIKDDGALLFHLSNRYLDLYKVLQGVPLPKGYALYYAAKNDVERPAEVANTISGLFSHSQVVLIAKETALPDDIAASNRWNRLEHNAEFKTWTDDFSNILGVLRIL